MSSIRVTRGGDVFRLPCNDTDTLLALLRRAGCTLPAACGGHGRCGKCRVSVNGVPRLACRVVPEDGDEIVLPPAAGGRILTETLDPPAVPTGETGCAAAIDLGTTTTALRLYDLATGHALATCADWTALAPYGADVITRIQYTIDHQDGLTRLSSLLCQQLKALLTRALSQANTIKDKYLRYYMQRSTFYINKLERHRTHLYKTALSFGQERLLRELRSPTPIEQEYKSFFHEFDRVFLSLYPDFVEKANALLRDGEQMKTPGLNTEFRLLAVIRLGITGNSEIAQFLHISINTVYTYRNRLRNAAKCPPAEFERRIMEIV